ncbi:Hepatocyte growth factor [Liparis tanakae]|uniref:Hepatocyte growth factor n=1 Tax=Liparis tanakae TaxID=230148 RepID=A0A4Z2GQN5_9TELE|nr:Hepatocyte growth factor [Liparis tanakae]
MPAKDLLGLLQVVRSSVMCCWRFYPDRYPTQDLRENFCRNPNNDPGGPWCYTTDPNVRAEECGIPRCSEDVCMTCNGEDYRGKLDHTESGKECQRWDSRKPNKHHFQPKKYRHRDLRDNYCRNPDNRLRPWCFTLDPNTLWEYCNITVCDLDSSEDTDVNVTTSCVQGKGKDYRGIMNVTPEGVTCQRWDSQSPHNHSFLPQNFKCKDLSENYCRNPDGADHPWCFTTDPNQRIANCTHIPSVPDLRDYSVQVGLRHLNESSSHPRLRISRLICGPEGSNLVMLKLDDPAPVSEGASTMHLPVKECHITEGTNCTMYGWGETKNSGYDEALNALTMPMVNNEMCSQIKGDAGESRICAGGKRGEGVCDKDNGGPLVCQEHERKVIVGVSIQRTKCASSQPALFVNVAFYSEWIYKVFKLYPSVERN